MRREAFHKDKCIICVHRGNLITIYVDSNSSQHKYNTMKDKLEEVVAYSRKVSTTAASIHEMDLDESELNDPFLALMEKAGNHGRYQTLYNYVFVAGLAFAGAMIYMNIILALNMPEHWCTVPGRELTNYTLDQWRDLTLPK